MLFLWVFSLYLKPQGPPAFLRHLLLAPQRGLPRLPHIRRNWTPLWAGGNTFVFCLFADCANQLVLILGVSGSFRRFYANLRHKAILQVSLVPIFPKQKSAGANIYTFNITCAQISSLAGEPLEPGSVQSLLQLHHLHWHILLCSLHIPDLLSVDWETAEHELQHYFYLWEI